MTLPHGPSAGLSVLLFRRFLPIAALALAFCAPVAKSSAQWNSLPRQEPDGGTAAQAGWGAPRYSLHPQAATAPAAETSWTSWLWPFPATAAQQPAPQAKVASPAPAQQTNTGPRPTPPVAATVPPVSPATALPRPWFESDQWSVSNMPGQSAMRGAPQASPPTAQPPQQVAHTHSPPPAAPGPRLAALPYPGQSFPGAATTSSRSINSGEFNSMPRPEIAPTTPYNGHGLPGQPLSHSQYTGIAPEPVTSRSLVAEGLANVDPDEMSMEDYEWRWQMLPKSLIYHTYLAGVKEPRLAAVFNSENNRGDILDLTAGARMGILRYGTSDVFFPDGWQLDVEGAAFTRLDPEENMDMEATDYKFGVPLTYGYGCYQMKFAYSHLSSHLGDEFAIRNGLAGRVNYSRDALVWGHSLYATENLRFYFEVGYAFISDVNEPWDTQFGIEYSPICNGRLGAPFAAFNTHLRQEVNFGGNFVMQVGWQWTSPETAHRIRIGLQYYNGNEEQFEFYSVSEQKVGLGLWYDY